MSMELMAVSKAEMGHVNIEGKETKLNELKETGSRKVIKEPDVEKAKYATIESIKEENKEKAEQIRNSGKDVSEVGGFKSPTEKTQNNIENAHKTSEIDETKREGLTNEEKNKIKEETGWSDEIIEGIQNMKQYEILRNANLKEVEINGRKCLVKEKIDLDYTDADGISNRDRIERNLSPLDGETGETIELHHLGQKADSPLVELTEKEHRTGDYENNKKNQSLWHDSGKETEVHGEGNNWNIERNEHWKTRLKQIEGGNN